MSIPYFVICCTEYQDSRCTRPQITWVPSYDTTGIKRLEDADRKSYTAPVWAENALFARSIVLHGEEKRVYDHFNTDEYGASLFIVAADYFGYDTGKQARAIVKEFNSLEWQA